jgi:hypothetical protein
MTRKEILETKKALRRLAREIESFEKRSKLIKVVHKFECANRYYTQINVAKKNKVVEEMIEYIKSLCDIIETEENGSMWLCNYDEFVEEDENSFTPEFNILIRFAKNK